MMTETPESSFPTTHWSEIARLESPEFASAIASLCQQYWYPIYVFIRRRCGDSHRAEDLTQEFFAKVIAKKTFRAADPSKGRFRSYLLVSVRNFIANVHASERTQARGGNECIVPIDFVVADRLYLRNRSSDACPEVEFDRAWAMTVMEHSIKRLREEYLANGQLRRFELLSPILRSVSLNYDHIAADLQIDSSAARKAASRFRKRYGQILRNEISTTLSKSGDLEDEIAWMMRIFSS